MDDPKIIAGINGDLAIAEAMALMIASQRAKHRARRPPTPQEIAASEARKERDAWNRAVEERKAEKRAARAAAAIGEQKGKGME